MVARLEGKVAVVTGGSSGIGRATALAFAREGAKVIVGDVATEASGETVRLIKGAGGEATFVRCDVSQAADVQAMVNIAVTAYGRLDCAFNNAGIEGAQATTADYPEEVWNRVISINLTGVWLCLKYEIAQMLKQDGGGAIVNNASILGTVGFPGAVAYTAAKHGVLGLTKVAALEYSAQGIRVNAVCPGFILTPMLERAGLTTNRELLDKIVSLHPIGRLGKPEEIAEAVIWLCSDAASFVTGHPMLVDGGYIAQ
ncbi:MAG: SDR family oxidoreductase [Chloroflexi bacterium]|nr:SDR family oxidoreductase [Chloroflexota bacterium]